MFAAKPSLDTIVGGDGNQAGTLLDTTLDIFPLWLYASDWSPSIVGWVALRGSLSDTWAIFMAFSLWWGGRFNQSRWSNSCHEKTRCWNSCDSILVYYKEWKGWYCRRLHCRHPSPFGELMSKKQRPLNLAWKLQRKASCWTVRSVYAILVIPSTQNQIYTPKRMIYSISMAVELASGPNDMVWLLLEGKIWFRWWPLQTIWC